MSGSSPACYPLARPLENSTWCVDSEIETPSYGTCFSDISSNIAFKFSNFKETKTQSTFF